MPLKNSVQFFFLKNIKAQKAGPFIFWPISMYKGLLFTNRIEDYYLQIEYKVQNYGKKLIDLSRTEHKILSKAQKLACSIY